MDRYGRPSSSKRPAGRPQDPAHARAVLRLRTNTNASAKGPAVYVAPSSWAENTLTWANRPATTGAAVAAFGALATSTWYEVDVTSAVSGAGDLTFALVAQSTDGSGFLSRETTSKPQLIITP